MAMWSGSQWFAAIPQSFHYGKNMKCAGTEPARPFAFQVRTRLICAQEPTIYHNHAINLSQNLSQSWQCEPREKPLTISSHKSYDQFCDKTIMQQIYHRICHIIGHSLKSKFICLNGWKNQMDQAKSSDKTCDEIFWHFVMRIFW